MSLESHLNDATFGESMAGNGFDYSEICPHKGHPGGPGGVRPPPPQYTIYIRTRCKSQGLRKSKRNACSGYCKSGILMSDLVLRRGGKAQFNPDSAIKVLTVLSRVSFWAPFYINLYEIGI